MRAEKVPPLHPPHDRIPVGLAVTGILLFGAALVALVTGISLWTPGPRWNWLWNLNPAAHAAFSHRPRMAGTGLLVLSGVTAGASVGLLRRRRWAWRVALVVFAGNALGDVLEMVRTHQWVRTGSGAVLAGVFILLLARSGDRLR